MNIIGAFSGGGDSATLMAWMSENIGVPGVDWIPVICETVWEHPLTDVYVEYVNRIVLNGSLVRIKSQLYPQGFIQLVKERGRVPSTKARFCTDELKTKPMVDYIKALISRYSDEIAIYQGIRRDESLSRSKGCAVQFDDRYDCEVRRPLFDWTKEQCFAYCKERGIDPNPLYLMGARRVGCFPCVMVQLRELKAFMQYPELRHELTSRVAAIETSCGSSYFPPNFIPERFHTGRTEEGKTFPWCADVWKYVNSVDANQLPLLEQRSCMSVYNLCE